MMMPREHAVATINSALNNLTKDPLSALERTLFIDAVERGITLAVQEERNRCLAWVSQFDTPQIRRIAQGIDSGSSPPGEL